MKLEIKSSGLWKLHTSGNLVKISRACNKNERRQAGQQKQAGEEHRRDPIKTISFLQLCSAAEMTGIQREEEIGNLMKHRKNGNEYGRGNLPVQLQPHLTAKGQGLIMRRISRGN